MRRSLFCLALAALLAAGTHVPPVAAQPNAVTVFAAASLTEAFNAAGGGFHQENRDRGDVQFGGSDTLATQIKQGAPVDVFASANLTQMKVVSDAGLVAGAPQARSRKIASCLIRPKAAPLKFTSPADLAKPGTKSCSPPRPCRSAATRERRSAKLSGSAGYPADFPGAVEKNVVSNELDVKAVVTKIALGEGDAGVVYSTDVTPSVAAKLNVLPFPASVAPDIEYPIAASRTRPNPKGAQAFVDYILSPEGQAFLKARGFISP